MRENLVLCTGCGCDLSSFGSLLAQEDYEASASLKHGQVVVWCVSSTVVSTVSCAACGYEIEPSDLEWT